MGGSVGGAGNFGNQQMKARRPGMNMMDDPRQAMMAQQRAMQGGPQGGMMGQLRQAPMGQQAAQAGPGMMGQLRQAPMGQQAAQAGPGMINQLRQAPMGQQGMMGQQRAAMGGGPQGGLGNMLMQEAQGGQQDPRLMQRLRQSMGGRGAPGGK